MNQDHALPHLEWRMEGAAPGGTITLEGNLNSLATPSGAAPRLPLLFIRAGASEDYVVSNENSRQPLFINGQQVRQAALRHGDVLNIGQAELVYDSPLPLRSNTSPLHARTLLGALVCSILLFAFLLPFLTRQLAGLGEGTSGVGAGGATISTGDGGSLSQGTTGAVGSGTGTGAAAGQSAGASAAQAGATPSGTGAATAGTQGDTTNSNTPGTDPKSQPSDQPPAPAANSAAASPQPPTPGNSQSGQPQPMPVQPGAAPAPKIVRAIGQIATFSSSGRSIPWTGGNPFQGYENAKSIVFVVDRSSSMRNGKLDAANGHMFDQLPKQKLGALFSIVYFNTSDEPLPGGLQAASKANIDNAKQWSDGIPPNGGTDPESAILTALKLKPEVIWILSDGGFSPAIVQKIKQANSSNTVISTIGFFDDPTTLKQIAEQNRGTYRYIAGP